MIVTLCSIAWKFPDIYIFLLVCFGGVGLYGTSQYRKPAQEFAWHYIYFFTAFWQVYDNSI